MLMDGVCIRKDDLIFMFEQIFGNQKLKKEIPRSLRSQHIAIRNEMMAHAADFTRTQRIMSDPIEDLVL